MSDNQIEYVPVVVDDDTLDAVAKKIHTLYAVVGWKILCADGTIRVPSQPDIEMTLRHIIASVNSDPNVVATGTAGMEIRRTDEYFSIGLDWSVFNSYGIDEVDDEVQWGCFLVGYPAPWF